MQSVHITTNVVSSNPAQARCIQYNYAIKFVSDLAAGGGFLQVLEFLPPIKNDRRDITEMVLKVALNTITLTFLLIFHIFLSNKRSL